MRALFVGLGSIGNRHSINLRNICQERKTPLHITALRSHLGSLKDDKFEQIDEMITSLGSEKYDIAFITNPTILHLETFEKIKNSAEFFFVEKPIFGDTRKTPQEIGMSDKNTYIAAPMRFCQTYVKLKELLQKKKVFSSRILCSSYLPDWRPKQDYRKTYSAQKELGGGVSIDLIHEIDYMVDLFGFAQCYHTLNGQYSNLEIDSNDLSITIAKYENMLCEVHLDYFGRTYRRTCECFCDDGTIIADFGESIITLTNGSIIDCKEDLNIRYLRELEYFLDFTQSKKNNVNPPSLAFKTLKIALGESQNNE